MPCPKPTPRQRGAPPAPPSPWPWARRRRPGQRALQEIRRYQSSARLLLRPGPFAHLVQEICLLFTRGVNYHWQRMALLALQEAAEAFIVRLLEDTYLCSLHARQVTLFLKDLQLVRCLRGAEGGGASEWRPP
ncbi:histone H3-like centromeric protein A [Taeniopygia guttata]|uniref:histone H3-like centromeric protein A n=1 Tax=Taeniopygia guttata TaxID=59729 RepID=UPI0013F2000C|nr:histone H3-like centromeric protein A [Taeniopygia guttata]